VGGIAEHRFLRFTYYDGEGEPRVLDFHGLATDRTTGVPRPIGVPDKDNIAIWPVIPSEDSDDAHDARHLRRMGTVSVAESQRMMAGIAVGGRAINDQNIEYRAVQTDFVFYDPTTNSNAANRTLLELAGYDPDTVRGGWAPGFTGRLMPPTDGDHGRMSIDGVRTRIAGFSDEDIRSNVAPALTSLLNSTPASGDVMNFDNRGMDEAMRRLGNIDETEDAIKDYIGDMTPATADRAPAPGRAPGLH